MPQAEAAARKALELDPQPADAAAALAYVESAFHWRWPEAERLYRQAIALNPSNARARHWFSTDYLVLLGRFEEAFEQVQLARMLDPLSLIIHECHAYIHLLQRDFEGAAAALRKTMELDPAFFKFHSTLGRALSLAGRYAEAIPAFEQAAALTPGVPSIVAALGQTKALAGDRAAAHRALEELAGMSKQRYVPCSSFAVVHLGLGDNKTCLDWLEQAVSQRELPVSSFNIHPLYDPLRAEPRFHALLRRVGFLP